MKRPAARCPSPEKNASPVKRPASESACPETQLDSNHEDERVNDEKVEDPKENLEEPEEETKESDVEVEPDSKECDDGNDGKTVSKKPAAAPVLPEENQRLKSRGGMIFSTTNLKDGWKMLEIMTANGRKYFKWVHPDGKNYYFSRVKAREAGMKE